MTQIEVGNKQYDYYASAALLLASNKFLSLVMKNKEEGIDTPISAMVENYIEILHRGMVSGRECRSLIRRTWLDLVHPIPSISRLPHLVDFSSLQEIIQGKAVKNEEGKAPK